MLGISLHWLMQMDDDAPCYSIVPEVDSIIDAYGMMGQTARGYFSSLIQEVKKGEEEYGF